MNYTKTLLIALCITFFSCYANAGLLGSFEKKNDDITDFPKWANMLSKYQNEEQSGRTYCSKESRKNCNNINEWKNFIKEQSNYNDKFEALTAVNRYINSFRYISDNKEWGQDDHWETVNQFLTKGGDCEDFAIAKFITLRKMGFSNDDMRVLVLQNPILGSAHAVLVVYINKKPYFLDNEIPKVVTEKDYKHYTPVYSINETNWWRYKI